MKYLKLDKSFELYKDILSTLNNSDFNRFYKN
jgi:hypothetical protein